jgi:hypothetical protein
MRSGAGIRPSAERQLDALETPNPSGRQSRAEPSSQISYRPSGREAERDFLWLASSCARSTGLPLRLPPWKSVGKGQPINPVQAFVFTCLSLSSFSQRRRGSAYSPQLRDTEMLI